MIFRLNEKFLIEYNEKQIEKFKQIYDELTYNLFVKSKDRLKNAGHSTDIDIYLKGSWKEDPNKLKDLLNELDKSVSTKRERKTTAELEKEWTPEGKYIYYGKYKNYDVYEPLDVEASMSMGINTGWCTTGRYGHEGHPEFKPSYKNAEKHWKFYMKEGTRLIYLLNPNTHYGEWAIEVSSLPEIWISPGYLIEERPNLDIDPDLEYEISCNFTVYNADDDECELLDDSTDFIAGLNTLIGKNLLKFTIEPYEDNADVD